MLSKKNVCFWRDFMCPSALAAAVTAAAVAIAEGKSNSELTLIASVLTQLADTIFTIVAARQVCPDNDGTN